MKLLKVLGILLVLIIATIYVIAFTGFGNNLIKPYIEQIAKEKSGQDIKLSKFDLRFGNLDVVALVNNEIEANVKGDYSIFSQSFDLEYKVDIQDLKSFKVALTEPMGITGKIRGVAKNFDVNGAGKILDSNVNFLATLKDFKPYDVDLDAKGLNLEKALAIANQKGFISGNLDAIANIKNGVGTANINSKNAAINKNALKDINITIPENIALNLNSDIALENQIITASSQVTSNLANIEANKTTFDLNSKNLESDFNLNISNLANLEPFTKQKLSGGLNADGFVKVAENKLDFVDFNLNGFGGDIKAHLKDSVLNTDIKGIQIAELMGVVAMPKAVLGVIDGKIQIDDVNNINNIKGNANLAVLEGHIVPSELKKLANLDFPKENSFTIKSDTKIENGVINSTSNLISNLFKVDSVNAVYNLKDKNLKADFVANVDDLSKLKDFTKKALKGNLKANGNVAMANNALSSLNLDVKTLGGAITADSNGKNLNAKVSNLNLDDIFGLIGQNPLASGLINADIILANIDPKNLNGNVKFDLTNSILNEQELSKMLKKEFPKDIKLKVNSNVQIANSVANFTTKIDSDLANVTKFDGSFDINSATLNANYEAVINDLSKLAFATGKKMIGNLKATGDIKKDKTNLNANLYSDLFSGKLHANVANENIKAKFDKFQIIELTQMLDFGKFYTGVGDLIFNYNTKSKKGDFNVDINEGHLTPGKLTSAVSLVTQKDITKEVFNNSYVKGTINQDLVNFNSHMKAPRVELNATSGTLDTKTSSINIPVSMLVEKTDLSGTITGTTKDPKVDINSKYLEKKLDKVIDKGLDKLFGKDKSTKTDGNASNITNTPTQEDAIKDGVKDLIKGFF